eukprot:TRINITY_DN6577_c0_g1_i7.p1 TRINITY_DN6577_c0_g1~~TRINITY_DN6577_c0_g1_i7.p1  ORF type:complete len:512 (+),score=75.56 TRINITY_DN6577_c0_g1_i7:47-1582(+)
MWLRLVIGWTAAATASAAWAGLDGVLTTERPMLQPSEEITVDVWGGGEGDRTVLWSNDVPLDASGNRTVLSAWAPLGFREATYELLDVPRDWTVNMAAIDNDFTFGLYLVAECRCLRSAFTGSLPQNAVGAPTGCRGTGEGVCTHGLRPFARRLLQWSVLTDGTVVPRGHSWGGRARNGQKLYAHAEIGHGDFTARYSFHLMLMTQDTDVPLEELELGANTPMMVRVWAPSECSGENGLRCVTDSFVTRGGCTGCVTDDESVQCIVEPSCLQETPAFRVGVPPTAPPTAPPRNAPPARIGGDSTPSAPRNAFTSAPRNATTRAPKEAPGEISLGMRIGFGVGLGIAMCAIILWVTVTIKRYRERQQEGDPDAAAAAARWEGWYAQQPENALRGERVDATARTIVAQFSTVSGSEVPAHYTCTVCLETAAPELASPRSDTEAPAVAADGRKWSALPCEHGIHEDCLFQWVQHQLTKRGPLTCPVCRTELNVGQEPAASAPISTEPFAEGNQA